MEPSVINTIRRAVWRTGRWVLVVNVVGESIAELWLPEEKITIPKFMGHIRNNGRHFPLETIPDQDMTRLPISGYRIWLVRKMLMVAAHDFISLCRSLRPKNWAHGVTLRRWTRRGRTLALTNRADWFRGHTQRRCAKKTIKVQPAGRRSCHPVAPDALPHRNRCCPVARHHCCELQRIRVAVQPWNNETGLRGVRVSGCRESRPGPGCLWGNMGARCRPLEVREIFPKRTGLTSLGSDAMNHCCKAAAFGDLNL